MKAAKSKVNHGEWLDWFDENCPEISRDTSERYRKVYFGYSAEMRKLTPMPAYKALGIVRDANDITEPVQLPPPEEGKYRTIVVDPPWQKEKIERKDMDD